MNLKDVLNADMTTTAGWIREGFQWWWAELAEMLPRNWRKPLLRKPPAVAELRDGTVVIKGDAGEGASHPRSAVLVLPEDAALVRQVALPVLAGADTRRMLALDIDRLTPFRADAVVFDFEADAAQDADGRRRVTLAVMPKAALEDALASAETQGVNPVAVSLGGAGGEPRFDFLRAMDNAGFSTRAKRAGYWWAAAGALAAANILFLIYRDEAALQGLRDAVEAQETTAAVADRLRRKVDDEAARRRALMQAKQETPLRALAALTAAIPDTAWVRRFEWSAKGVHVAGLQRGVPNLLGAIERSPALRNARALTASAAAVPGVQNFDIAADIEREKTR
jgi:general secretion pathway protein L